MGWIEDIPDHYSKAQMVGIGIAFMVLPIVSVALRFWAKYHARNKITTDDYLVTAAAIVAVGCCILQLIAAFDGGLGQNEADYPDGKPILNNPQFRIYEQCKFAVNMLTCVGLGFVKSSIVTFYMNIFRGKIFIWVSRGLLVIIACWAIGFFFANLFTCYPITPFVESVYNFHCINSLDMWYAMAISDCITDLLIFVVPIPNVAKLHLPIKHKIAVIAIFLTGSSVIAFSITRTIMYFHVGTTYEIHYNNETYYTSPVFFWAVIELSTAVFCACLPLYRPVWTVLRKTSFIRRYISQKTHSDSFKSQHNTNTTSANRTLHDQSSLRDEKDSSSDLESNNIRVQRDFLVERSPSSTLTAHESY